jgi:hypothetical protein
VAVLVISMKGGILKIWGETLLLLLLGIEARTYFLRESLLENVSVVHGSSK